MNKILLSTLLSAVKGVSPEAKYVLVRLVESGVLAGPVCSGVKELAGRFGISDSQMGAALNSLVRADVLVRQDLVSGQGRPKRQYELDARYVQQVGLSDVSDVIHRNVIDHLLRHERQLADQSSAVAIQQQGQPIDAPLARVRASRKRGRLSVVNRLLLAVLLCRADRFGVVRDLGNAELSRLTGLSRERLKNRVRTLLDSGLIRAYTPGATGSVIFKKTKSVYYLNLHHPELSCGQDFPMALVSLSLLTNSGNDWDVVDDVLHSPAEAERQLAAGVRHFFEDKHELRSASLLRGRLDCYAEYLLSRYWADYSEGESELVQLIKLDLRGGVAHAQDIQSLTRYLFKKAGLVAQRVRNVCFHSGSALLSGVDFELLDYALLPARRVVFKSGYFFYPSRAVLALPRDGSVGSQRLHVVEFGHGFGNVTVSEFTDLNGISREDQARYGLLT
ncbi:Lrp/AsnC family transcriptional regulator [Pseudomonas salmasensis]|uniref:Lrp/AsnC family transcriptional regulator n=1 Tax=Pseudomonas salmasensis TaxID=2745514 RepID=UPI00321920FD